MAMTFRHVALAWCAGALVLAAAGCGVEPGSSEEGAIESRTGAVTCDTSYYGSVCASYCVNNGCTDGNAISSCVSACIGNYCAQQMQFRPDASCSDREWLPAPASPRTPTSVCQDDVLQACQGRCALCNTPTTQDRGACSLNCMNTWCTGGQLNLCYASNRAACESNCAGETGDARYKCLAGCLEVCQ